MTVSAVSRARRSVTDAAAATLEQALTVDIYAEAVYRRLIGLYGRRGQPDTARSVYRRLQRHLEEIGLDPAAETREVLGQATQKSAPRLSVVGHEAIRRPD
jgi:pentatricopeptide repeat protein